MSAFSQYYQPLPSLQYLVEFIQNKFCPISAKHSCREHVHALYEASYVDIDFDSISHSLVFNAYWATAPRGEGWDEKIETTRYSNSIEIGILNNEKPDEPEEQRLGGLLTVIGADTKPSTSPHISSLPPHYVRLGSTARGLTALQVQHSSPSRPDTILFLSVSQNKATLPASSTPLASIPPLTCPSLMDP